MRELGNYSKDHSNFSCTMYRGITTFNCTNCGHEFKSHDIEYRMLPESVPQRCPKCGSVRTMPCSWIDVFGMESSIETYTSIWKEIEEAEKKREEHCLRSEEKMKANEEKQRKKRAKKCKRMSHKQREAYDKKLAKKAAKRSKITTFNEPTHQEEVVLLGPTWFPPGTPLRVDEDSEQN